MAEATEPLAEATAVLAEPTAESEVGAESTLAPTDAVAAAPTETKAPRLNLEATDPSTVSLAAGKPQLVEFFAFW